jgi:class 3 adenylate cyclase
LRAAVDAAGAPIVFATTKQQASVSAERRRFSDDFLAGRRLGDVTLLRERSFAGTIDRYPVVGELNRPSFAAALAEATGITSPRAAFRIAWKRTAEGEEPFPIYPAHLLSVVPPDWLRGKIVLVGSLLSGQDEHRTPISLFTRPSFGIEIHAHALAQIVDGATRNMPPWAAPAALTIAAAMGLLLASLLDGPALIVGLLILVIAIWVGPTALFAAGGPLILPMPATLAFFMAAAGFRFWRGREARRDHRILRQIFARHVSAPVAQELWRQRDAFLAGGRPRPQELVATVLFADVAGFTTLCERLPPAPLIDWLDQYIDVMVQAISANHGVVLRFVGDGILAAFGTPVPRCDEAEIDTDAQNATRSALAMVAAMRQLNDGWRAQGLPAAGLRIGLHTGPVVAGCLGRGEKLEYCLLGDTANTGARIEALGKDYVRQPDECIILVGDATYARLNENFAAQPVGEIKLRGKEQSVGVYRICDDAPAAIF